MIFSAVDEHLQRAERVRATWRMRDERLWSPAAIGSVIVAGRVLGRAERDALVSRAEAVLLDAAGASEASRD